MNRLPILILLCGFLVAAPCTLHAGLPVPIYNIDHPTAGLLEHGEYHCTGRVGPESSILVGARAGFKSVVQVGASFGVQKVFDRGDVDVNDKIGFQLRLRLIEESLAPALSIGFDSQGRGFFREAEKRYDRKSPGFYAVVSKNYLSVLGEFTLHGGINYSMEDRDDNDPNLFVGTDWRIIEQLSILFDADAARNDNVDGGNFGKGGIYIDGAIRLDYGESLTFMLIFRDLTGNFGLTSGVGRELEIAFWDSF
jgi:hypothetical protein